MKRLLLSACVAGLALMSAETKAAPSTTEAGPAATSAHVKAAKVKTAAKTTKPATPPAAETVEASATPEPASDPIPADQAPETTESKPADAANAEAKADKAPHFKSGHPQIDAFVVTHAKANNVPEALVHRVIVRESKYQPDLVGRCGCIGLMQIKLGTARALGYTGDAQGLRDPETNLRYGVKYLAGAYRAANGDHDRAVHYFAAGYYEAAKRQRLASADITPSRPARAAMAMAPLDITPKGQKAAKAKHAAAKPAQVATSSAPVPAH